MGLVSRPSCGTPDGIFPGQNIDGINYLSVKKNGLYLLCTTKVNATRHVHLSTGRVDAFQRRPRPLEPGSVRLRDAVCARRCDPIQPPVSASALQFNVSPNFIIELLNRLTRVFKDYCGVLSEESIRKNFILIYELLDEVPQPRLRTRRPTARAQRDEPNVLKSAPPLL